MHRIPIISPAFLPPPSSGHLSMLVPAGTALLTLFPRQDLGICKQNNLNVQKDYSITPLSSLKNTSAVCVLACIGVISGEQEWRGEGYWNLVKALMNCDQ